MKFIITAGQNHNKKIESRLRFTVPGNLGCVRFMSLSVASLPGGDWKMVLKKYKKNLIVIWANVIGDFQAWLSQRNGPCREAGSKTTLLLVSWV